MKRAIHPGTTWSVKLGADKNIRLTTTVSEIISSSFNNQLTHVQLLYLIMKLHLDLSINIIIDKEPKSKPLSYLQTKRSMFPHEMI